MQFVVLLCGEPANWMPSQFQNGARVTLCQKNYLFKNSSYAGSSRELTFNAHKNWKLVNDRMIFYT